MKQDLNSKAENFVKSKYLSRKEYDDYSFKDNYFFIKGGEKHKKIFLTSELSKKEGYDSDVICLSNRENAEWIIKNWEKLINKENTFFFLGSHYWALNPKNHNKIIERKNLRKSVMTLLENN